MNKNKCFAKMVLALLLVTLSLWIPDMALAMSPQIDLGELAAQADVVLTGRVHDLQSGHQEQGPVIYTDVTIQVGQLAKGQVAHKEVVVRLPGGEVDGMGLAVSGVPRFKAGEEVLLFLRGDGGRYALANRQHAKYTIQDGRLLENHKALDEVLGAVSLLADDTKSVEGLDLDMARTHNSDQDPVAEAGFKWGGQLWGGSAPMEEPFLINENTSDCVGEGAAVIAAAETWSAVPGANFRFTYGGSTTALASLNGADGLNVISWKDLGENYGVVAEAYVYYYADTGHIYETDIQFNDYRLWSASDTCPTDRYDVENIAAHELGHWLRLLDLYDSDDFEKTMCGYSAPGEMRKRSLHDADVAGAQYVYPGSSATPVSISPNTGLSLANTRVSFTGMYEHPDGWEQIKYAELLLSDDLSQLTDAVLVRYDVQNNLLYLQDRWEEGRWEPSGGLVPGTSDQVKHGLTILKGQGSMAEASGTQLSVTFDLYLTHRFGGLHNSYLRAVDLSGADSGWVTVGDWRVNNTPEPVYFGAAGDTIGVDDRIRYGMSYRDADGIDDMDELYLLITDTAPSDVMPGLATSEGAYAGATLLRYDVRNDRMYLRNIMDTKWKPGGGMIPNTKDKEKWPHTILRGVKSWTEEVTDKALYVRYNLQLRDLMGGENRVWMRAVDVHGASHGGDSGWMDMGILTVGSTLSEDAPQATDVSPSGGISQPEEVVVFDAVYGDGSGWQDLEQVELLLSDSASQLTDAVRIRYDVQSDALYLQDRWEEGVWEGGVTPGIENPFQHGLVTVYPGLSSVQTSGEQLTVSYALSFKSTFGGLHASFAKAQDQTGESSDWVDVGQWRVNNTPEPVYFGAAGDTIAVDDRIRYGMSYRDADGIENMDELYLLITDTTPSDLFPGRAGSEGAYAGAALLRYDVENDRMYLRNIKDTKWKPGGGMIPDTKDKEKWPHAILRAKKSWTEPSTEKALYVRYNLQLRAPMAGENRVWMRAVDVHGASHDGDSGWIEMGTLAVTP